MITVHNVSQCCVWKSDVAELIYKCGEGEVIHCRGLASPQGLIDLIDQEEDQEEEGGEEEGD